MNKFEFRRIGVASDQTGRRPSLHDCIEAALPVADILIRDVLTGLADAGERTMLYSTHSSPVPLNAERVCVLCDAEPLVTQAFLVQLKLGIYSSSPEDFVARPVADLRDLELLDADQIDACIEFALALQEVSRCVEDVLPALDALISSVSGWVTVQPSINPLKAEVFVQVLLSCLKRFVKDTDTRAALLIPAAGLLGVSLRQFYLEMGDWLRSFGIEPAWPVGGGLGGEGYGGGKMRGGSVSRTMATLGRFRKLLGGEGQANGSHAAEYDFMPTVPFSYSALEDLKLLKPMMQRLAERESQLTQTEVKQQQPAAVLTENATVRSLSQQLGEEVVRLQLDKIAQDQTLLPAVRDFVSELEPALLGIAASDPRYFSDCRHPARQLLDWLVDQGRVMGSKETTGMPQFLSSVATAAAALAGPQADATQFASVLGKLRTDWMHCPGTQGYAPDSDPFDWEINPPELIARNGRNASASRLSDSFPP